MHRFQLDSDGVYRATAFNRFEWLEHGFGTRGASHWPELSRLAMIKQVHSARVVAAVGATGYIGEGDALVTDRAGLTIGIRTADCVPILLVDPIHRAVAAVHAGWRGTAKRIVVCTILELVDRFGTVATDVYAAIGPAIGACCYQVGPDVAREFAQWRPELLENTEPVHLNLVDINRQQLVQQGVPEENISTGAPCTFCTPTLHSFRRDKESAGRAISAIGIR